MACLLPRTIRTFAVVLVVFAGPAAAADSNADLKQFAQRVGLSDVDSFVAAVEALRANGRLPPRYVTKHRAERLGWHPGGDLCRVAPGDEIGGDRFRDHAHQLPDAAGRRWREADLDEHCGRRGAHRLIWSNDGLYFVTVDHYRTFLAIPAGAP
jgi:ribonuclease T1